MWSRVDLKARGKQAFVSNYWNCVVVLIILGIAAAVCGSGNSVQIDENGNVVSTTLGIASALALLLTMFVLNPLSVGVKKFYLENASDKVDIKEIFSIFRSGHYLNIVITEFMKEFFISLWSLLFIVPGIIKSYSYMMVEYILIENPDMAWNEVLKKSKEMMNGQKGNAFVLDLSFLGWWLLSLCTLGILAVFYVEPYVYATDAELYITLRDQVQETIM